MEAEAGDDVAMAAVLICGELEHAAMFLPRVFDKFLREIGRSLQIRELFGMSEGQEEERFLPRCLERGVVTDVDPFECEPLRFGILRECLSGSAMDCARELIEYDDKGKTRPWALRPVVQFAPFAARANNGENRSI